jgi:hypothetical protein
MLTIRPIIRTIRGPMEELGRCMMRGIFTVRTLDGLHVLHIPASEVIE